ncbi:MAG TPA: glycosyltransferase family 39 protein [Alphaproteobacteria bacterium]|nr:glycosyltransferase family 39 protein [Alphaproteobacteria bacterium]
MHVDSAPLPWRQIALAGLGLMIVVILTTFRDYGITWDAHYHMANGEHVLAYYASFFADKSVLTYHNLYLYGGLFDGIVALANVVSPLGPYETSHLLNAIVGLIGVAGCWKLANILAGPRAAFFAAVLLLLMPTWYGHMFNNPKDIPFAAAMTWTLYYIARLGDELPSPRWGVVAKLGVAAGLTMGMRVGGVLVFVYLTMMLASALFLHARSAGAALALRDGLRLGARAVLPAALIAYAVMLACWPWAQQDPLRNPFNALRLFSHIKWDINVLYEGRLVNSLSLPADFLPVSIAVQLPEIVLILLLLAIPVSFGALMVRRATTIGWIRPGYVLLFTAIAFPFVHFVILRPVTYDCARHFLFILPSLAVAAGIVADRLVEHARAPLARGAVATGLAAGIGAQVATMVSLHPHEYVYYNELVGGVKGAEDKFELDYWGNSYAEAVRELTQYLERERGKGRFKIYRVAVCSSGISASYFFPPFLKMARNDDEADFYVSVTRLNCDDAYEGDEIIAVEREGAILSVVKDRRRLREEHPERMRVAQPPDVRVHPGAHPEEQHSMVR